MSTDISILLLNGFDESFVLKIMKQLQIAGLKSHFIGLQTEPIFGEFGLSAPPINTVDRLLSQTDKVRLIVPPCHKSQLQLMTEPRLHRFFEHVIQHRGTVFVSTQVATTLARVGVPKTKRSAEYHVIQSVESLSRYL